MNDFFKNKIFLAFTIIATITIIVSALFYTQSLDRAEYYTIDHRIKLFRKNTQLNDNVKIVMIDDNSLQQLNPLLGQWPWSREVYSALLEFMSMGGAKAVLFDILFTELEDGNGLNDSDMAFVQSAFETNNSFQAFQVFHDKELNKIEPLSKEFEDKFSLDIDYNYLDKDNLNNTKLTAFKELWQASKGIGVVEFNSDSDGVYRRVKLFKRYDGKFYPTLSVAGILDEDIDFANLKNNHNIDSKNNFLVNPHKIYEPYSFAGIIASMQAIYQGETDNLVISPDEFKDKIVFIGASAIGLHDLKHTAIDSKLPGVYLHASIASNLLDNDMIKLHNEGMVVYLSIFIMSLIVVSLIFSLKSITLDSIMPLIVISFFVIVSYFLYGLSNIMVNITAPILSGILSYLFSVGYLVFSESSEKKRVRAMLSQYVSPAVLNVALENPNDIIEAEVGKKKNMSIVFSDIRGFTTISENHTASEVVQLLNIHLGAMTDITFDHLGTMDKFIGDATMAFWGAPVPDENHPTNAVNCAIDMAKSMTKVNEELKANNLLSIDIGVGVNSDDVILGNIGSAKKLDFTVIGDGVNLASRLEGLTKNYGVKVLISEFTYHKIDTSKIHCATLDLVQVKGKAEPVAIYAPLLDKEFAKEDAKLSQNAFELYKSQDFKEAINIYNQIQSKELEKLVKLYIDRCEEFIDNPPSQEWDGVYVFTTK